MVANATVHFKVSFTYRWCSHKKTTPNQTVGNGWLMYQSYATTTSTSNSIRSLVKHNNIAFPPAGMSCQKCLFQERLRPQSLQINLRFALNQAYSKTSIIAWTPPNFRLMDLMKIQNDMHRLITTRISKLLKKLSWFSMTTSFQPILWLLAKAPDTFLKVSGPIVSIGGAFINCFYIFRPCDNTPLGKIFRYSNQHQLPSYALLCQHWLGTLINSWIRTLVWKSWYPYCTKSV
jgi:hypothetical protein